MDSASLGGDRMTENVKKRVSKWDKVPDTQFSNETVPENSKSGDAADTHHDRELNSGVNLSKSAGTHVPSWSDMDINNTMRSKDSFGGSWGEPMPEGKGEGKDGSVDRGGEKISPSARSWGGRQSYGASIGPRVDGFRQHSRSRSPKSGWGKSHRSRSRSPHGLKHDAEGWNDRVRSGKGGSNAPCRDFAAGRCRRGSQCRYLHQDDRDYDGKGRFDSGPYESRGRRQERGEFSLFDSNEAFTDSQEQSGHSRDKLSHGHDSRNDGDQERHEPRWNRKSSGHCNDFLKGKCYRGSACKYLHHGANADGYAGWRLKDATRERAHHRGDDTFFGREPRRISDTLCKFFAEGCCRNGERCKFSHQVPAHGGPEEKSRDGGRGDNSVMGNRSWEDSTWSDNNNGAGCPENQSWNGPKWGDESLYKNVSSNQLWDGPGNMSWEGDKEADKNASSSPWCSGSNNARVDDPGNRSGEGSKWSDKADEKNISNPPSLKSCDDDTRGSVPESNVADQFLNGADMASAGTNRDRYPLNMGNKESLYIPQDSHTQILESEGHQKHVSTALTQPMASEDAYIQQQPGSKADAAVLPSEDSDKFTNSTRVPNEIRLFGNILPVMVPVSVQSSIETGQNQHIVHPPHASIARSFNPSEQIQLTAFLPPNLQNLNPDRQSQQIIPPASNVQHFNPSGQSKQILAPLINEQNVIPNGQSQLMATPILNGQINPIGQSEQIIRQPPSTAQSQILLNQGESSQNPDLLDVNMSQLNSEIPIHQNTITTENGAQITNLSASLAEIFGNGQQLPQLYATLNHLSATGLVPSQPYSQSNSVRPSAPMAAPFIQPDQGPWPHKQYDPIQDSTESKLDISNQPSSFPLNSHDHKSISFEQLQAPQQILTPTSVTDGPNEGGPPKSGSLEKSNNENQDQHHEPSMDTEAVEMNEAGTFQCEKNQQISHLKEMDADDQVDEENKRSTEAKGMRMFKFALVEFVKELLKPTWKEGHMSKEAHKTIVKKVVDKVTGAMQGPHIPQTQEKIDQYLSYSKSKLTKLVHAYVEKYLKT